MEAGHFDSACPAIEESERIDPRPGTLFTVAECDASWGKVATALARYQEYVDLVPRLAADQQQRHKARVDIANAQIAKLKPTVPTLTLVLPANAAAGTSVTRNGEVLKGAALGLPLPVDPGEYSIVTHAPGGTERETRVSIALGEAKRVSLDVSAAPAPSATPTPSLPSGSEAAAAPAHGSQRRTAAYVAGGIGIAGVALGAVTGILVIGKKDTIKSNCSDIDCNDAGLSAANSAKTLATISDIGFGVGLAGLAVGTILLLTGGSESTEAARARGATWHPVLVAGNGLIGTGLSRSF